MDGYLSLEIIIYKHLSIASNLLVYPKYKFHMIMIFIF
jgi:hypothetical protein